jgi:hypothetical protein
MAIVIDINLINKIFPKETNRTDSYQEVHNWLFLGKGKIAYGGKKYKTELYKMIKYRVIISELEKKRKIISLNDNEVDLLADQIKAQETDTDFDDEHLVAILQFSKSTAICTADVRAEKFIRKYTPKVRILKDSTRLADTRNILRESL